MLHLIWYIIVGLIAGCVAKALPRQPEKGDYMRRD